MSRPAGFSDDEDYDSDFDNFGFEPRRHRVNNIQPRERSPEEKLFDAVKNHDIVALKAALDEGADINCRIRDNSVIMEAALEGHFEIMELLIQNGANVNDEHKMTTVMMCLCNSWCKSENELLKCLKLLLEHGADPKAKNWTLGTPLMLAVRHNHVDLVTHFLEIGCDVNGADSDGYTPIFFATQNENLTMVRLLLDAGASVNVMDRRGNGLADIPQVSSNPALAALLGYQIDDGTVEEAHPSFLSNYRMAMLSMPKKTDRMYGFSEDAVQFVRGIGLFDVAKILQDNNVQLAELLTWDDNDWKRSGVNLSYYIRKIELAVKMYHEHPWGKGAIPRVESVVVDGEVDLFAVVKFFMDFLRVMHISSATSLYMLKYSPLNAESVEDIDKMLQHNSRATQQLQRIRRIILKIESEANTVPPDLITARDLSKRNSGFCLKFISFVLKLSVCWRLPSFSDIDF